MLLFFVSSLRWQIDWRRKCCFWSFFQNWSRINIQARCRAHTWTCVKGSTGLYGYLGSLFQMESLCPSEKLFRPQIVPIKNITNIQTLSFPPRTNQLHKLYVVGSRGPAFLNIHTNEGKWISKHEIDGVPQFNTHFYSILII